MKVPRVTPLEGVSTYALRGIRVRGVENPQGFGIDERRYIVPGLHRRGLAVGGATPMEARGGRGLGIGESGAGNSSAKALQIAFFCCNPLQNPLHILFRKV